MTTAEKKKKAETKLVLGLSVQGQLKDIPITEIDDPTGTPDRIERPADKAEIAELARSLREVGQIQPIMVEDRPGNQGGKYVRVFGRRRLAAAELAGITTIRAIVVPPLKPDQRRTIVAVENIQRKNLTPIEEHLGVWELCELAAIEASRSLKLLYEKPAEALADRRVRILVTDTVAAMLAKPAEWVRDRMYIGRLGKVGRQLVRDGKLPLMHAREIAKVATPERREALAEDYAVGGDAASADEPGSIEELRGEVGRVLFSLDQVPWNLSVSFADKQACSGCPHNSFEQPGLFEHGGRVSTELRAGLGDGTSHAEEAAKTPGGICTYLPCFEHKLQAAKAALNTAAKRKEEKKPIPDTAAEILRPEAIEKKLKERKARAKEQRTRIHPEIPSEEKLARQAREAAQEQLGTALRVYAEKVEKELVRRVEKTPGLYSLLLIARKTKLWEGTTHWDKAKARKAAAQPGVRQMLSLLSAPSWAAVTEMEKGCGRRFALIDAWHDGQSGMAALLAEVLELDAGRVPQLEDFLDAQYHEKPAEAKPKPAAKPKKSKVPMFDDNEDDLPDAPAGPEYGMDGDE